MSARIHHTGSSAPLTERRRHQALTTISFCLLLSAASHACQVPVFRYALERWEPASYKLTITPGSGGLTSAEKDAVQQLQHPPVPANLKVDLAPPSDGPLITLHDPRSSAVSETTWQARQISPENVETLLESPVRKELSKRLLSGQTAVWLLLESGDAAKDNAAFATLQSSLKTLTSQLKLPDGVTTQEEALRAQSAGRHENADVLLTDLPLKIEFSILRVSRRDAREAVLMAMLMRLEPDLGDFIHEPMAFPVFGRGRALEPLIGKGIRDDNLLQTASYLCGACSCEIKDRNPGMDLLISADWATLGTLPAVETVRIDPSPDDTPSSDSHPPASSMLTRIQHPGVVVAFAFLLLVFAYRYRKSKER